VDTAEDKTALGTFPYNTKVNAVIVEDDNAIRTAWIWEVEEGDNDIDDNNPIATEVTKIDADNFKIYLNAFVGADNRVAVITRAMEKAGYTDVTFASAANNEYTVTAQVKSSSGISTSLTFTTVTRWFSDSAIGAENVDNYNNAADLPDNSALIGDGSDLATITGGSVGTDITAGDNMMFTYTTKGTGNVVLTISDRSGVVYRETHGTAGSPSASVAAGQHYFYISLDNGSLNTSSTSNKVDTANDKCLCWQAGRRQLCVERYRERYHRSLRLLHAGPRRLIRTAVFRQKQLRSPRTQLGPGALCYTRAR